MGLLNSAGLIVLTTAFLFASSTAYTSALLRRLGLDSDLMERSFHQVLYHGFIINLLFLMALPLFLFFISFIAYEIKDQMHRAFRGSNSKRFVYARKFLKPLRKVGIKFKRESYIMRRLGTIRLATWMTLSCSVFFVFVIAHHEQQGGEDAVANIESIKKGETPLVYIDGDETGYPFLYCGARNCAVYDKENDRVKYFAQDKFSVSRDETSKFKPEQK
ncbi:hypothetical protein [Aeromonas hydrophila]|uniref:hypothetical protein n=2 Tax=Aeromonas hydrophila TaxID=644 RepID=UPI000B0AB107|nr:hypothetical protein [Aeromonas hydrophila]